MLKLSLLNQYIFMQSIVYETFTEQMFLDGGANENMLKGEFSYTELIEKDGTKYISKTYFADHSDAKEFKSPHVFEGHVTYAIKIPEHELHKQLDFAPKIFDTKIRSYASLSEEDRVKYDRTKRTCPTNVSDENLDVITIVMEYIEGYTLFEMLEYYQVDEEMLINILAQIYTQVWKCVTELDILPIDFSNPRNIIVDKSNIPHLIDYGFWCKYTIDGVPKTSRDKDFYERYILYVMVPEFWSWIRSFNISHDLRKHYSIEAEHIQSSALKKVGYSKWFRKYAMNSSRERYEQAKFLWMHDTIKYKSWDLHCLATLLCVNKKMYEEIQNKYAQFKGVKLSRDEKIAKSSALATHHEQEIFFTLNLDPNSLPSKIDFMNSVFNVDNVKKDVLYRGERTIMYRNKVIGDTVLYKNITSWTDDPKIAAEIAFDKHKYLKQYTLPGTFNHEHVILEIHNVNVGFVHAQFENNTIRYFYEGENVLPYDYYSYNEFLLPMNVTFDIISIEENTDKDIKWKHITLNANI